MTRNSDSTQTFCTAHNAKCALEMHVYLTTDQKSFQNIQILFRSFFCYDYCTDVDRLMWTHFHQNADIVS